MDDLILITWLNDPTLSNHEARRLAGRDDALPLEPEDGFPTAGYELPDLVWG